MQRNAVKFIGFENTDQMDNEVQKISTKLFKELQQHNLNPKPLSIVKVKNTIYEIAGRRMQLVQSRTGLFAKVGSGTATFAELMYDIMVKKE